MLTRLRLKSLFHCLLLFVIIGGVAQWISFKLFVSSIGQKREILTAITNSPLITLAYIKTGVKLDSFQIIASDRPYAMMIGMPNRPYMILSSKLNETFNDSEKEYIVLHEIGHYVQHHSVREGLFFVVLFIVGCFLIRKSRLIFTAVIGIIFGLLCIQYGMVSEKEADRYALAHITDPQGMISSTEKFRSASFPPLDDYSPIWPIIYRSNPYHVRIEWAQAEIERRKNLLN